MNRQMIKCILAMLALATFTAEAQAQCQAAKNTGSLASPSSDAGRCANEGGYCYLGGKSASIPEGKCESFGRPGNWSCRCSINGVVFSYFVLGTGTLTTIGSPPGTARASIGILAVNGFSGAITATCSISEAPSNTSPSCSLTPASQTIGSSGGFLLLSVPTQGLAPGNYTVKVIATADNPVGMGAGSSPFGPPPSFSPPPNTANPLPYMDNVSLTLSIPAPKASGGTSGALISFAVLLVIWTWRHKEWARYKLRQ
jgi:hypothetical protein